MSAEPPEFIASGGFFIADGSNKKEVDIMKKIIDIKSYRKRDFSTKVVISDQQFLVETEIIGSTRPTIKSHIYRGGEIVLTYKQEIDNDNDIESINDLMVEHHQLSIEAMREELQTTEVVPEHDALLDTVGNIEEALDRLQTKCPSNNATGNIEMPQDIIQPQCIPENTAGDIEEAPIIIPAQSSSDKAANDVNETPVIMSTHYTLDNADSDIEETQTFVTPSSNLLSESMIDYFEEAPEMTYAYDLPKDVVDYIKKVQDPIQSPVDCIKKAQEPKKSTSDYIKEVQEPMKSPSDYIKEINILIARKSLSNAMGVICEGIDNHPKDPSLLSLYGYLIVKVQKDYRKGIHSCKKAIEIIRRKFPFDPAFVYPNFFLNLGKAYIEAGDRKHAVDTFAKVLYVDENNSLARTEMRKLGARRRPLIAFLSRSNPLNKYAGIVIYRLRKRVA
jgi:tetratricopeptide (TPR) repeat protein